MTLKAPRSGVLILLASVLALLVVPSCTSKDDGDSEGGKALDLGALQDEVTAAMEEARELGADSLFKDDFERAMDQLQEGESLVLEGEPKKARIKLKLAKGKFLRLKKTAAELNTEKEAVLALQRQVQQVRQKAKQQKVDINSPQLFKEAEEALKQGIAAVQSTDARMVRRAGQLLDDARARFEQATQFASENLEYKGRAETEKAVMLEWKGKAAEKEAEKHAVQDWVFASQQERTANSQFEGGDYRGAVRLFQAAGEAYAFAYQQALAAIEFANARAKNTTPAPPPPPPTEGETPQVVDREPIGWEPPVNPGGAGDIELPPAIKSNDDLFLTENISKLSSAAIYNPATNEIMLDYSDGLATLRKEYRPIGTLLKDHMKFQDIFAKGESLSLVANTQGYILTRVPFKDKITIEFNHQIQVMDNEGSCSVVFFASENGLTAWHANFVTLHRLIEKSVTKNFLPKDRARMRSPNYWFDKLRQVPMRIEVGPNPNRKNRLLIKVFYDYGNELTPTNVLQVPTGQSGYFGFAWRRVKFIIRDLKVTGQLDKEVALEKLGFKTSSAPRPSSDEKAVATGPGSGSPEPARDSSARRSSGKQARALAGPASGSTQSTGGASVTGEELKEEEEFSF